MSTPVIQVENLAKLYRIAHQQTRPGFNTLRDVIADQFKHAFRKPARLPTDAPLLEDFWALKDVSFEINQGDVVGIIGRNGAALVLMKVHFHLAVGNAALVAFCDRGRARG